MTLVTDIIEHLRRLVTQPIGELNRAQRTARYLVDFARHCTRTLAKDRAPQMAAALTYRTIFSLVPTLVLSLLVFKAFYRDDGQRMLNDYAGRLLNLEALTQDSEARQMVEGTISEWVSRAFDVNANAVGGVGLLLLIWGAIALLVTVEQCFNHIYNAASGRAWHKRVVIYWSVFTLGPVLASVSMYLASHYAAAADVLPVVGPIFAWLRGFTTLGLSWLLLLLLYVLVPATKVQLRAAAIGAFVAAVLWEIAKWGFKLYVAEASLTSIYGSLGLLPLFLLWLYLSWLIVLFGLEIAYALQTLGGFRLSERQEQLESQFVGDPVWVVSILSLVARAFEQGRGLTVATLSNDLNLPLRTVSQVNLRLEEAGLIHRVQNEQSSDVAFTLSVPPARVKLADLLDLGRSWRSSHETGSSQRPDAAALAKIVDSQRRALGQATLADLLQESGQAAK